MKSCLQFEHFERINKYGSTAEEYLLNSEKCGKVKVPELELIESKLLKSLSQWGIQNDWSRRDGVHKNFNDLDIADEDANWNGKLNSSISQQKRD